MAENKVETVDFTPVEYDPQYILMVKDLKKYFPIKGGLLSKTIGHVKAVDGVTFNLKRGCTMGASRSPQRIRRRWTRRSARGRASR